MENMSKIKFAGDEQKQKELMNFVGRALQEEEMVYAAGRKQSIMSRRPTH